MSGPAIDAPRAGPPIAFDALAADWDRLALASERIFSTPEWARAWWSSYGRGRRALVLPVRDAADTVIGVAPLYVHRAGAFRLARFIGHGAGDELGPVCAPADRRAVANALTAWLRTHRSVDAVLGEAVPGVEEWESHLDARVLRQASSPSTTFRAADWGDYLVSLSSRLRRQVRYDERRLFREQPAAYRMTTRPEELERDLAIFFALHEMRWGSASSLLGRRPFYERFAAAALARDWLRLSFIEIAGTAVAAQLDFRYGGVHFHYNAGRNPAWDRYSVGDVLRTASMRDALAEGAREYRFLRGGETYKARFATHDRASLTLAVPVTARGRMLVEAAGALAGQRWGRRLLARAAPGG